jgi:predicted ATP-grasp superfamily ATP-dependent carboligase
MTSGVKTLLVLADTEGLLPDFRSAKKVTQFLSALLQIEIDTKKLDEEIARARGPADLHRVELTFTDVTSPYK